MKKRFFGADEKGEAPPLLLCTLRAGPRHFEACKFRKSGTGSALAPDLIEVAKEYVALLTVWARY